MAIWEKKVVERREEFKKSLPNLEDNKKDLIRKKLLEQPLIPLEEMNKFLAENGMLGLSMREKLGVLKKQFALLLSQYKHYKNKLDRFSLIFH